MRKAVLYFAFLSLFMCMKCEDDVIPQGKQVHVHGRMYDVSDNGPFANQKLVVLEFNDNTNYGQLPSSDFIGEAATVYTDENGLYDLTFITSGRGDTYYIKDEVDDDYIWTYSRDPVALDVTISNEVDFRFKHLYQSALKITTASDLDYLPVSIAHRYTRWELEKIEEAGTEHIRTIAIIKNSPVEVKFYRNLPEGGYQQAVFEFPPTDTPELTEFEVNLTNDDFQ